MRHLQVGQGGVRTEYVAVEVAPEREARKASAGSENSYASALCDRGPGRQSPVARCFKQTSLALEPSFSRVFSSSKSLPRAHCRWARTWTAREEARGRFLAVRSEVDSRASNAASAEEVRDGGFH